MTDIRPLRWHDLPLAYRLVGRGVSFDAHLRLIVGEDPLRHAQLTGSRRTQTYILRRAGEGNGLASLYYPAGDQHARLGFISPALEEGVEEGLWLNLLDGLAEAAGQRGTLTIAAEVDEYGPALEVLRRAGFAIYARQDMWVRPAAPLHGSSLILRKAQPGELAGVQSLYAALVPALIRQVEPVPVAASGIYVLDGCEGAGAMLTAFRCGRRVLAELYLHPEIDLEALAVINGTLAALHAGTCTVYFRVRRYMGWLGDSLQELGFRLESSQAVMVRHIAAPIRAQEGFKPLPSIENGLVSTPIADWRQIIAPAGPVLEGYRHH